jgi:hypothetical protein
MIGFPVQVRADTDIGCHLAAVVGYHHGRRPQSLCSTRCGESNGQEFLMQRPSSPGPSTGPKICMRLEAHVLRLGAEMT